jgi:hypothetical protein
MLVDHLILPFVCLALGLDTSRMVSLFILLLLLPLGMLGEFLPIEREVVFCHMTISSCAFISGRSSSVGSVSGSGKDGK